MSYDSVALGIVSPGASPRGDQRPRETFYYTLVFPARTSHELPRVSYATVCEMLRGVTAGGSAREARAIDELRAAWEDKFRSGPPQAGDMIPFSALQELVRNVIIAKFAALPGMAVQSRTETEGGGRLLLSFRPSRALLRATADRLKVRVPASAVLEVGSNGDTKLWGQVEAQEEIYRLFLAGKITAEETQIYEYEDSGMWSRRLRALQRFAASKSGISPQEDVVFLPYRDLAALRYVYRQIDDEGEGGSDPDGSTLSPFRVVDKIRITKSLIDAEFDCDALVERGLLEHHLCSHTYHATDIDTSLDALRVQWGALPTPWQMLHGLFGREHDSKTTTDPIVHVRNYFGEQLALYFAFASFSADALLMLGLVAMLLAAVLSKSATHRAAEGLFCLCSCAFLGIFVRKWELHEARYASRWSGSTPGDSDNGVNPLLQLPRPQFRGPMRRSPVTLRMEPYSSVGKSLLRRLASSVVLAVVSLELGAGYASVVASDRFQELTVETSWRFKVALGVVAMSSKCLTPQLARLSQAMTNWENHRLQRDYDLHLTFKFAVLQVVNCFGALWGLAFVRPLRCRLEKCRFPNVGDGRISTSDQAARLLLVMLGLEVVLSVWSLRWAIWQMVRGGENRSTTAARRKGSLGPRSTLLTSPPLSSPVVISEIEAELALAPYEGVLFDYAQVLVPLGFIAWFAPLAPFTSCLLAWLVAALQLRVDAYKLCYETQRPNPIQELSLGAWLGYLHVLRVGAMLHSTAFVTLLLLDVTGNDSSQRVFEQRVVTLGVLFALVTWISYAVKDPRDLAEERRLVFLKARQAALENKYLGNLGTHLAASAKASLPAGRVFLNGVPRYVVTGDKGEEDAAEELRDQWRQLQLQMLGLEKRILELKAGDSGTTNVGMLYVEVQGVSQLPLASPVQSFVQLCVQSATSSSRGDQKSVKDSKQASSPTPGHMENTSVSKKSRSPLWHENFELPVAALSDVLALRVCDGGPVLATQLRRTLGRTQLAVEDVIERTSRHAFTAVPVPTTIAPTTTAESKAQKAVPVSPPSSSSSEDEKEASEASTRRPSVSRRRSSSRRGSFHVIEVPMATYELPLELPESLRRTRQNELAKHGPPRLALRCGVQLHELGELLVQQRRLRDKLTLLRAQEIQLSSWGAETQRKDVE